jgi:hypothetical protein
MVLCLGLNTRERGNRIGLVVRQPRVEQPLEQLGALAGGARIAERLSRSAARVARRTLPRHEIEHSGLDAVGRESGNSSPGLGRRPWNQFAWRGRRPRRERRPRRRSQWPSGCPCFASMANYDVGAQGAFDGTRPPRIAGEQGQIGRHEVRRRRAPTCCRRRCSPRLCGAPRSARPSRPTRSGCHDWIGRPSLDTDRVTYLEGPTVVRAANRRCLLSVHLHRKLTANFFGLEIKSLDH